MKDALGERMKNFYEDRYRIYLTRRMPVVIRVDGNAFHTFTKGLEQPFDIILMDIMQKTCLDLCKHIQGCVGGYVQSDEISLLLVDYNSIRTDAWFDYNLQKITSIAAARATMTFNGLVHDIVENLLADAAWCNETGLDDESVYLSYYETWKNKCNKAMFDARAFNIPKEEVCNYFIWRQQDATRNSIQAAGHAVFSHKELNCKSCSDIQEMLFQKGINWNDYPTNQKRGTFVRKEKNIFVNSFADNDIIFEWTIDTEMPILTEDREYIDNLVYVGE